MKTCLDYLDDLKQKLNTESDYALAQKMDVARQSISKWRSGRETFSDDTCLLVARLLKIDPLEVLASANAQRAKSIEAKQVWERIARQSTAALLLVFVSFLSTPPLLVNTQFYKAFSILC